ncbi:MAG TPA: hypothetical protein VH252_04050 [Chthoniobacterales bacterium]|jgi:hypothetical protein|nr:hypothetical protein [Chthoniobacterales bacterium]
MQHSKSNAPVTFLGIAVAVAVVGAAGFARGQEIELPPIVVTGTFELRPAPSVTDLFTLHLQKQFETKRAVEETVAKSPWYYSRFWNYFPMRIGSSSSDSDEFFKPQYLTLENQKADWELRKSEKQSLFDRR